MTISFKTLCDTHQFEAEAQLDSLQSWCHTHVSSDVHYHGGHSEQHAHGLALVKHYLDHFLANIPANIHESVAMFHHLTALQYAALKGYDHYILSCSTASIGPFNQETSAGMTPLHLAAAVGNLHAVYALLNRGADPVKTNKNGQMPLFSALFVPMLFDESILHQKKLIFRALNTAAPETLAHPDSSGDTVFHLMATHGFESLMRDGLKQEPRGPFLMNNLSRYPIHMAILNQQPVIANLLLDIPMVATLTDAYGQNALHYAVRFSTLEMVQRCCNAPIDIHQQDNEGHTALALLQQYRQDEPDFESMETLLLEHGASYHTHAPRK